MKFENILIKKIPEPTFKNKVINKVATIFLVPILIVIFLIVLPVFYIYSKIKELIFGKQEENIVKKESIFFENEKLKLTREDIEYNSENKLDNVAENFLWSIVDYDDEYWVFKINSNKEIPELTNFPFTNFKIETFDELILQRINEKDEKPTSELISLNKSSNTVEILKEVGLFGLDKYDKETKIIKGYNRENEINIKVTELNNFQIIS